MKRLILSCFLLATAAISAAEVARSEQLLTHGSLFSPADETEYLLEALTNAHGVSGFERPVRDLLKPVWAEQGIDFSIDGMGNLVGALPCENSDAPRVLIMAHMDEVGFMITKVHDDGFISAMPIGGWMDHVIWGQKWHIQLKDSFLPAISGMDSPHVLTNWAKSPEVTKSQFFLDTGLSKGELDALGVRPGLPVSPDVQFSVLKPGKRYIGKAFDDRVGLAVMVDLMKALSERPDITSGCQVLFAAAVQEELGTRGSKTVYESLKPEIVLNIEAGIARDYPAQFTAGKEPVLGGGPALFIYDGSMMPNQNFVAEIDFLAGQAEIPMQWEAEVSYAQDASCLQVAGRGMPAVNIGVPVRYVHSHYGLIDRADYDNTVELLLTVLEHIDAELVSELP